MAPIDGFVLDSGAVVMVLAGVRRLTDTEAEMIADARHRIAVPWESVPMADRESLRMTLHGVDENGDRTQWDLAVRQPGSAPTG